MKFVLKAVFYVIVMNLVMFLGACIVGTDFEPNFVLNVVVPVLCAYASWETGKRKARKAGLR